MRSLVLVLVLALCACLAPTRTGSIDRALRQLSAAGESTGEILELAKTEAPELVSALEAVEAALEQTKTELRVEGRIDALAEAVVLLESALVLVVDDPRLELALIAVKAALLQVQASFD